MGEELANYYTKLELDPKFRTDMSNSAYLLKDLKKALNSLNTVRRRKAELRKEFYETLISLRLNMDNLVNRLPEHEARELQKQIKKIKRYEKESFNEKMESKAEAYFDKNAKPIINAVNNDNFLKSDLIKLLKYEKKNKDRVTVKRAINEKLKELTGKEVKEEEVSREKEEVFEKEDRKSLMDRAMSSERKELEMLKKDLERISEELKK